MLCGHEPGNANLYRIAGVDPHRKYYAWPSTGQTRFYVPKAFGRLRLVNWRVRPTMRNPRYIPSAPSRFESRSQRTWRLEPAWIPATPMANPARSRSSLSS